MCVNFKLSSHLPLGITCQLKFRMHFLFLPNKQSKLKNKPIKQSIAVLFFTGIDAQTSDYIM